MTRNAFFVMCFAPAGDRPFVSCLVCHETLLSPHVTKHSYDSCLALLTGVGLWFSGVGLVRLGWWPVGEGTSLALSPTTPSPGMSGGGKGGVSGPSAAGSPLGCCSAPFWRGPSISRLLIYKEAK